MEAGHYQEFPVICGHISRSDQLKWFPERSIITALREPMDRALSFIYYVRSLPAEISTVVSDAHRLPVLDFIETAGAHQNLYNTMVRQLGGHMLDDPTDLPALLEAAKQTLREALWVGRRETMSTDILKLGALLGRDLELVHENVTPNRPCREAENPEVLERLEALNRYDEELWQWAAEELEPSAPSQPRAQPSSPPSSRVRLRVNR